MKNSTFKLRVGTPNATLSLGGHCNLEGEAEIVLTLHDYPGINYPIPLVMGAQEAAVLAACLSCRTQDLYAMRRAVLPCPEAPCLPGKCDARCCP